MNKQVTRRTFVKAASAAGVALLVGFNPRTRSWITPARAAEPQWEKLPTLDGALLLDDASRESMAMDIGEYFYHQPLAVLKPGSVDDIVKMVQFANIHRIPIGVRGQGHSQYGRALVEGGIVVDSRTLNQVKVSAPDTVDTQPGATWNDVTRATLARDLTPPAMGNTMTLSVGGILSAGGWSNSSHLIGSVADTVRELDVVTGDGRLVTCSRQRDSNLFDMVRAGMGQCGLIVGARIQLVPAPRFVVRRDLIYQDLKSVLSDTKRLTQQGAFDHLNCAAIKERDGTWMFRLEVGKFCTSPQEVNLESMESGLKFKSREGPITIAYSDYLQRQAASNAKVRDSRKKQPLRSAFLTMFLPASAAEDFVARILATPPETIGSFYIGPVMFDARKFACPLFKLPGEDVALVLWIFRRIPSSDTATFVTLLESNRAMVERMRAAGGKAYPPYVPNMAQADWEDHYGPQTWSRLVAAKKLSDPNNILTPGLRMFVKGES
jgi:cytokinin dehydrogenase